MSSPIRITDSTDNTINIQTEGPSLLAYTTVYDYDINGNLIYQGWALSSQPGGGAPSTSSGIWAIRKLTYSGAQLTTSQWANGNCLLNNIWTNRASLSYQ